MNEMIAFILQEYKTDFILKSMNDVKFTFSKLHNSINLYDDVLLEVSYKFKSTRYHDTFHIRENEFYSLIEKKKLSEIYKIENGFPAIMKTLFDTWLKEKFSRFKIGINQFKHIDPYWVKVMDMKNFLAMYSDEELLRIHSITENDVYLPLTVKDVFLF